MNTYSGAEFDLRPCWHFEEVPMPGVGVIRDGDGRVTQVWERTPDGGAECVYPAEMHPAAKGAYLLEPGETDVPGRVF